MAISTGPAIRAVLRCRNGNKCGSGSIVGLWRGGSLGLTNAHVAGTKPGHKFTVEVESLGMRKLQAEVVRGAYSDQVSADWCLFHIPDFQAVKPVHLTKKLPPSGYSLYTKGFPKCEAFQGSDITQQQTLQNGVLLWLPDAIPGQSGSAVWGDTDHLQYALLTWSMSSGRRMYGAGQLTNEIYRQNRAFVQRGVLVGTPRMPGLVEVDPDPGPTPGLEHGIYSIPLERGIGDDFPEIWAEDQEGPSDPPGPSDPGDPAFRGKVLEFLRAKRDEFENKLTEWEKAISAPIAPSVPLIDDTFGL